MRRLACLLLFLALAGCGEHVPSDPSRPAPGTWRIEWKGPERIEVWDGATWIERNDGGMVWFRDPATGKQIWLAGTMKISQN